MNHGLTTVNVRVLVYQYARDHGANLALPPSWERDQMAGEDWLKSFMKRHPRLSIRSPEATSQSRAAAFNPIVVSNFFEKTN